MARRKHTYPGLTDPRAALAELTQAYAYVGQLKRRFHVAPPAWEVLDNVSGALRAAALELTKDPCFFGLGMASQVGQTAQPPPARRCPGSSSAAKRLTCRRSAGR